MDEIIFFDLMKAQRNKSQLVQVQRMVSRGGKTFPQNFWVLPSQVRATDKVIGGQQNLLPTPGSVPAPAKGVWDKTYFDSITQNSKDRTKAIQYLKDLGVTWTENANAGINWMRARQALNAFLGGQKATSTTQPVNSSTNTQTQQSAQNTMPSNQNTIQPSAVSKFITPAIQAKLDGCANGREKVAVLKQELGKDECMKFAKELGVTWTSNDHPAIDQMRMSMALMEYYDGLDGTVSPSASAGKGGGAPNGNRNAAGKRQPDELAIPSNATQRQKNIIDLINKIDNEQDLENFAYIGMVPEDDVSKSFILSKLIPKHKKWAAANASAIGKKSSGTSTAKRYNSNTRHGFGDQMAYDLKFEGCKKDVLRQGFQVLYDKFDMSIITDPTECISPTLSTSPLSSRTQFTTWGLLLDMRNCFSDYVTDDRATYKEETKYDYDTHEYVKTGNMKLYTNDSPTNLGYIGSDPDVYEERYDLEKEGFVKVVRKIAADNPNNAEVQETVEKMVEKYDHIMEMCHHNPVLLDKIMNSTSGWDNDPSVDYRFIGVNTWRGGDLGYHKPGEMAETVRIYDLQYDMMIKELKSRGCSDAQIFKSLSGGWSNDDMDAFHIYDEDGKDTGGVIDFTQLRDERGNLYLSTADEQKLRTDTMEYMRERYAVETGLWNTDWGKKNFGEIFDKDKNPVCPIELKAYNCYKAYKQCAEVTAEQYNAIHKEVMELFKIKLQEDDGNGNITDIDLSTTPVGVYSSYGTVPHGTASSDGDNIVMTNLIMTCLAAEANSNIESDVSDNARSKINHDGSDYSRNFTFYDGSNIGYRSNDRIRQVGNESYWGHATPFTADQLSAQIESQLADMPVYTSEYISAAREFYNAKSGFTGSAQEARKDSFQTVGIDLQDYVDSPVKDILYSQMTQVAKQVPTMRNRGVNGDLEKLMAKRMDYVPYDFTSTIQSRLSDKKKSSASTPAQKSQLRKLREECYKKCHCTVSVEDEATSLQMRKDFMKNWDYNNHTPEITPDGISVTGKRFDGHGPVSHDRRALFNSRFFRVNNGNMEEAFDEYVKTASDNNPMELYHAGGYSSVGGILGVSGGWLSGSQAAKVTNRSGQALGPGAYFGWKGGKSWVYCGDDSYSMQNSYGAVGDNGNGCYILCTCIKGNPGDSRSDHGRFNDFEIAISNMKCIKPHHFVDISARSLNINVQRDANGNYLDSTGKITHDRYGKSVTMQ